MLIHGKAHEIDTSLGKYERFHDYCREIYGKSYDDWSFGARDLLRGSKPIASTL